jgi:hypothetical protein
MSRILTLPPVRPMAHYRERIIGVRSRLLSKSERISFGKYVQLGAQTELIGGLFTDDEKQSAVILSEVLLWNAS